MILLRKILKGRLRSSHPIMSVDEVDMLGIEA